MLKDLKPNHSPQVQKLNISMNDSYREILAIIDPQAQYLSCLQVHL